MARITKLLELLVKAAPAIMAVVGAIKAKWSVSRAKKKMEGMNEELRRLQDENATLEAELDLHSRRSESLSERRARVLKHAERVAGSKPGGSTD